MRQRLISAAVLVPVVVIVFLLGDPEHQGWLIGGLALLAGAAAFETSRLLRLAGLAADTWLAVLAAMGAVLGLANWLWVSGPGSESMNAPAAFVAVVFGVAALFAIRYTDASDGFRAWLGTSFAALYAGLLGFAYAIVLIVPFEAPPAVNSPLSGLFDAGRTWLLVLVLTVWALDSAAYLFGRYYPRGRFMNHISPNKTWSGALGGTVVAIAVATALVWATGNSLVLGVVVGGVVAFAAQVGDLAESMLKRAAGVKDSGSLIRGHGGILDRLDSFLVAAPAMFVVIVLWNQLG
jgi:phosphatidate cytidylyltransferase